MEAVSNNPSSDTCNKRGQDVIDQVANPVLEDLCSTCRDQLHNNRCSNEQLATEIRINVMFKFYATLKQRETHSQIENNSDTKISHTYTRELTVSPIDFVKMAKGLRLYPNLCDLQLIKKVVMKQNIEMQK